MLDGAGWHLSTRLRVPPNITPKILPLYSPERNSGAMVCQWHTQRHLANPVLAGSNPSRSVPIPGTP